MAKQKTPSPQEMYKARKAREEKEKNALLPPGLVNHGNTCFMNSVLQGLIATQYLEHLVQFKPIPPAVQLSASTPVASHRSPELTNGHGVGGEFDLTRTDGLPIGDQFITVMLKAWAIQNNRKRENMSPKDILSALGNKYEQYMDFRQQDAHEFLCQLLDAMRMEEMDIIKKRSPALSKSAEDRTHEPPTKAPLDTPSAGGDSNSPQSQAPSASPAQLPCPPDEELLSFVDMLFGGKLTSVLVCQTCKHVSHTYEDFNDLSLSIKPEDYVRERKRDKLKQLAKKLRNISGTALSVGIPMQRSSSVPATPNRDSTLDSPEVVDPQRRRSIDLADVEVSAQPTHDEKQDVVANEDTSVIQPPSPPAPESPPVHENSILPPPELAVPTPPVVDSPAPMKLQETSGDHVEFAEPEKINGKEKKDKDKDESWAKLSRRISVTVGLTKNSWEQRRRSKEERKERKGTLTPAKPSFKSLEEGTPAPPTPSAPTTATVVNGITSPDVNVEREPTSLSAVNDKLQAQLANVKRSLTPTQRLVASPSAPPTPRFPSITRPSSPANPTKRPKPTRAPKLGTEEAAYLRDILADINPPGSSRPFSIWKQPKEQPGTSSSTPQNMFHKFNQLGGVEECLRLFTSVEVLDGENMVRCHRCWKIANGVYKPRAKESAQESDSCTDSDDDGHEGSKTARASFTPNPISPHDNQETPSVGSSTLIPPSPPSTSLHDTQKSQDTPETITEASIPHTTAEPLINRPTPPSLQLNDGSPLEPTELDSQMPTYGGLPIPLISTTAPESPMSIKTARPTPTRGDTVSSSITQTSVATASSSRTSLSAPFDGHRRDRATDSNTESDGLSEEEGETLLSSYSDVSLAPSPTLSPNASQEHLGAPSQSTHEAPSKAKQHPSGVPRSKQVVMRPAYKRYLIATPPPILVVHLKRFQQTSKGPVVSFSSGFKKLDDYISFPEYLDVAPYLAPRREDYFESKVAVSRGRARRSEPCMYRLYAVVVHIGNMLGGHYVAYTALPSSGPDNGSAQNEKHQPPEKPPRDWAYISDTVVRLSSMEEVLKSKAYICMYERI
ncbi:hypothetical protein HYDPIDRAFT_113812 [Hydnomerulius pinastri MD-312]|uniref:ubiquitinyl hydrolase 1 n=1 Tax=Hydnomerulius pinastri MD-312 TaxID=994086 RepID=A0A0C9VY46_9AGAM|nr:hypothetical protein HYDPIDRAFT_113812 [Hydnomerulius pinastri MD-312]